MAAAPAAATPPYSLPPTLRLTTHPTRGRCLVAAQPIPAHTLVLLCAPAALLPSRSDRCAHCLLPAPEARCSHCKTSYCAPACQRAAWPDHRVECPLLKAFTSREGAAKVPPSVWVPLLLLARVVRGGGGGARPAAPPLPLSPAGAPPTPALPALRRPPLADVLAMQSPATGAPGAAASEAAGIIALGRALELLPAAMDDAQLASLHAAMALNNFSPTDEGLAPVAFACYPTAALLNHSCRPNCALSYGFVGSAAWPGDAGAGGGAGALAPPPDLALRTCLAVRTLLPIAEGEELCHAYVDITLPRAVRAADLRARYGFACDCATCSEEAAEEAAEAAAAAAAATAAAAAGSGAARSGGAAAAGEASASDEEAAAIVARAKAMIMRSKEIATEPTLPLTIEVLQAMAQERADPPAVAADWQDAAGVVALEIAVLAHALRLLLRVRTPPSHPLLAGGAKRLLETAMLCGDWATAEAVLVFRASDLARRAALAPYCAAPTGWPRHPLFTTATLPLSAVYEEWGRGVAGATGGLDTPAAPAVQARREALAGALGLGGAAAAAGGADAGAAGGWGAGGYGALPLRGATPPTARALLEAGEALAARAASVLEGAWGATVCAARMRGGGGGAGGAGGGASGGEGEGAGSGS